MVKSRIYIVDDHPIFRLGLGHLLAADAQFDVVGMAESAAEALTALTELETDLAIVDLSLNGASGLDLIKKLRRKKPKLPILVMSMHDEALFGERALRAGATGYLMKDVPPDVVLDGVRRALRGELTLSAKLAAVLDMRNLDRLAPKSALEKLSDRELQIFEQMGRGRRTREIAEALGISVKTVETHQSRVKAKLAATDANALRRLAVVWCNDLSRR